MRIVGWVLCTHHPFGDSLQQVGAEHPPYTCQKVGWHGHAPLRDRALSGAGHGI